MKLFVAIKTLLVLSIKILFVKTMVDHWTGKYSICPIIYESDGQVITEPCNMFGFLHSTGVRFITIVHIKDNFDSPFIIRLRPSSVLKSNVSIEIGSRLMNRSNTTFHIKCESLILYIHQSWLKTFEHCCGHTHTFKNTRTNDRKNESCSRWIYLKFFS